MRNDLHSKVQKRSDDFDKCFKRHQRFMVVAFFASIGFSAGIVVFLGWVIVQLLSHFGVI